MVLLGVLLLALSGVLTVGVVARNTDKINAEAFNVTLSNVSIGGMFLLGAAAGVVFTLGLWMLVAGLARKRRRRVQQRTVVRENRRTEEELREENARLAEEVEAQRRERERLAQSARPAPAATGGTRRHDGAPATGAYADSGVDSDTRPRTERDVPVSPYPDEGRAGDTRQVDLTDEGSERPKHGLFRR